MTHAFAQNEVLPERQVTTEAGETITIPPFYWFPKCTRCGTLVSEAGGKTLFRPTGRWTWTTTMPPCASEHKTNAPAGAEKGPSDE